MDILNRNDVPAFITKDGSQIREILSPANSAIERQSLAEALLPPGEATDEHSHPITEEIYYILSGAGRMRIEGEERDVGQFDGIAIPPGALHKIWNTGEEDLVFLCMCVPRYTHEDTVLERKGPAP
jgi:mannose-6-phosphate isomerase-like protein (cupin superfamily)